MIRRVINDLRSRGLSLIIFISIIFIYSHFIHDINRYPTGSVKYFIQMNSIDNEPAVKEIYNATINFEGFNNITGAKELIIPNIIHFIRFNKSEFSFVDYVILKAAMRNHKPDHFFYHTNVLNLSFTGKYWDRVQKENELWSRNKVLHLDLPQEIFGQQLSTGWRMHHGSDIERIRTLMKYGGIYLDNDVYVIKNLTKYRKFEFVLNWDENQFLGNQVFMAHKDARFLPRILDTYKEYHSDRWYYNGGERPTVEILYHHPELIHRVKGDFGVDSGVSINLFKNKNFDWRKLDAIHLLINHQSKMDPNYNKTRDFDEDNIQTYEFPFGEMAREVIADPNTSAS